MHLSVYPVPGILTSSNFKLTTNYKMMAGSGAAERNQKGMHASRLVCQFACGNIITTKDINQYSNSGVVTVTIRRKAP